MLCAFIDESMIKTHDTAHLKHEWIGLVQYFYQDSCAGERFFLYVEPMLSSSAPSIELIELTFWLLNLGYLGKYFNDVKALSQLKRSLWQTIKPYLIKRLSIPHLLKTKTPSFFDKKMWSIGIGVIFWMWGLLNILIFIDTRTLCHSLSTLGAILRHA
jgi:type IV/VI secretion system ImpK/VasF family protein